jgi:plasmid stability protein
MPSLQVRELPENIYQLLQKKAKAEHRSLSQEAIALLAKGLNTSEDPKLRRADLMEAIKNSQLSTNFEIPDELDPANLIRKDRDR